MKSLDNVSEAAWIASRLGPAGGWVGSLIPQGFEAYVRVLHPAGYGGEERTTWAQVAAATGKTAHALMQYSSISGSCYGNHETWAWDGQAPDVGSLERPLFEQAVELLQPHTDDHVFAAVWNGFGDLLVYGTTFQLPGREYFLFERELGEVDGLFATLTSGWPFQSPQLLWPTDHSWFLSTEIDLDSTVIGGRRRLIDTVLATEEIEAWEVREGDSLMFDGDTINGVHPAFREP